MNRINLATGAGSVAATAWWAIPSATSRRSGLDGRTVQHADRGKDNFLKDQSTEVRRLAVYTAGPYFSLSAFHPPLARELALRRFIIRHLFGRRNAGLRHRRAIAASISSSLGAAGM